MHDPPKLTITFVWDNILGNVLLKSDVNLVFIINSLLLLFVYFLLLFSSVLASSAESPMNVS